MSTSELPRNGKKSLASLRVLGIMTALSLSLFICGLDQTSVATAIPTISAELNSATGYVWIGGAFLLGSAATGNIWVSISDIWGRRPVLLIAVFVLSGGSVICATSVNMALLITGRAIQGVGSGGVVQLIIVVLSDIFSLRLRGLFLGVIEGFYVISSAVGPLVGGYFAEKVSWRWIFWINLPISGLAFFLLLFLLDVHNPKTDMIPGIQAIDWAGSFFMLGLTVLLLVGLNLGGARFPWDSPTVICLIVSGCLVSLIFLYTEARLVKKPLMPLHIFKNRSAVACLVVGISHSMVTTGEQYYLPLYFQSIAGATPSKSGFLSIPFAVTESISSLAVGFFIHWRGRYIDMIWLATVLLVLGAGLFIDFNTDVSMGKMIGYQLPTGIASGILWFAVLIAFQSEIAQDESAAATATFGFARNMAMSFSVVLGGVFFQNGMVSQASTLRAAKLSLSLLGKLDGAHAAANAHVTADISDPLQRQTVRNAFSLSLRGVWIFYACIAACGPIAAVWISNNALSSEHVETQTGLKQDNKPDSDPGNQTREAPVG